MKFPSKRVGLRSGFTRLHVELVLCSHQHLANPAGIPVDWLYKISITCFAASYLVVFLLEFSRVFFRARFRRILLIGFAAAGLFAHTVYLFCQSQLELDAQGIWLGNWFGWCLTTAWLLAAAYLWISIRQPESIIGLFVLPIALALIWIGIQFGSEKPFTTNSARSIWNMIHGISLLLGTVVVALGFIFGVVYLWQAHRLKRKLPQLKLFRLPSLEWLQQSSERSLVISAVFLAIGLLSGIAINQVRAVGQISQLARCPGRIRSFGHPESCSPGCWPP